MKSQHQAKTRSSSKLPQLNVSIFPSPELQPTSNKKPSPPPRYIWPRQGSLIRGPPPLRLRFQHRRHSAIIQSCIRSRDTHLRSGKPSIPSTQLLRPTRIRTPHSLEFSSCPRRYQRRRRGHATDQRSDYFRGTVPPQSSCASPSLVPGSCEL